MTPAEVLAMRDRLAEEVVGALGDVDDAKLADWLIESGCVTKEPERKDDVWPHRHPRTRKER